MWEEASSLYDSTNVSVTLTSWYSLIILAIVVSESSSYSSLDACSSNFLELYSYLICDLASSKLSNVVSLPSTKILYSIFSINQYYILRKQKKYYYGRKFYKNNIF